MGFNTREMRPDTLLSDEPFDTNYAMPSLATHFVSAHFLKKFLKTDAFLETGCCAQKPCIQGFMLYNL